MASSAPGDNIDNGDGRLTILEYKACCSDGLVFDDCVEDRGVDRGDDGVEDVNVVVLAGDASATPEAAETGTALAGPGARAA